MMKQISLKKFSCTVSLPRILTVNSEIFARTLFSRNVS